MSYTVRIAGSPAAVGVLAGSLPAAGPNAEAMHSGTVILLPGLGRTSRSMKRMAAALRKAGYRVVSVDYPSTRKTVEALAREDVAAAVAACQREQPAQVHFVTHSLGGIVLRQYLADYHLPNLGRIVMLGTPNHGSEVVDRLGHIAPFRWINVPAGLELGTAADALPNTLPVPPTEVGVIAGTRSINWFLSACIPGPDDGKVSVERAKLAGMRDFATVPTAHPFLMRNAGVIERTIRFLRTGKFEP